MARIAIQIGTRGASLIHDTFDPAAVLEADRARAPRRTSARFPTQAIMLLDHPDRPRRDLGSLRAMLLGGAPSSPELIRRVQDELGVTVSVRYSSTEVGIATGVAARRSRPRSSPTTVGKPTPGVELRIVDDDGRPLPAGEVGDVEVRSPATMRGYWRDPDATAAVARRRRAGSTPATSASSTTPATCTCAAGGARCSSAAATTCTPAEIEDLLATHPKVARAAVVGVPDDRRSARSAGRSSCRATPADPPTLAELRAFVGAELASFKRPDGLTLLPEMPVTPMFKVDKQALRALRR